MDRHHSFQWRRHTHACRSELKDERYVYVAAIGSQELVRFDRRAAPMTKRTVSVPIRPDNIHWASDGKLLTAGPN